MSLETKANLNEETIETLQDLIQINIDSANGFEESAKEVSDDSLKNLFIEMGNTRNQLAKDLQAHVEYSGERPRKDGSFLAGLHQTWLNIRSKLNGGDPTSVLTEAERGEDYIKHAYEDALKKTAGSAVNDVLTQQYATVKNGHDRIADLRAAYETSV